MAIPSGRLNVPMAFSIMWLACVVFRPLVSAVVSSSLSCAQFAVMSSLLVVGCLWNPGRREVFCVSMFLNLAVCLCQKLSGYCGVMCGERFWSFCLQLPVF